MKITIKKKEPEARKVYIKDVKPGYVFEIPSFSSLLDKRTVKALKLSDGVVMLEFAGGDAWFQTKDKKSWENEPIKVLGKLTGMTLEE